ncbi:uncharacterized protein [Triticum aestivum]|uniref:uncharacterized protein n=1 Tax=Triticum aestivum TaxID=4565 RepID=UPI001D0298A4|nr:uncharacterized protein LOC123061140 [Triticum aestivum]
MVLLLGPEYYFQDPKGEKIPPDLCSLSSLFHSYSSRKHDKHHKRSLPPLAPCIPFSLQTRPGAGPTTSSVYLLPREVTLLRADLEAAPPHRHNCTTNVLLTTQASSRSSCPTILKGKTAPVLNFLSSHVITK